MPTLIMRFAKNKSGATAIEYAFIGALTSIAIVSGVVLLAGSVSGKFEYVSDRVTTASNKF